MINNRGIGKFELLTLFVLAIAIVAFLLTQILGGASSQQLRTMKNSVTSFLNHMSYEMESNSAGNLIFLDDAISSHGMSNIKNPFGSGNCSGTESYIEVVNGKAHATLKCGDYIIENVSKHDVEKATIYKVGKWQTKKQKDSEAKKLYNCNTGTDNISDDYVEDKRLFDLIYKMSGSLHNDVSEISECTVEEKTFYRTKVDAENSK